MSASFYFKITLGIYRPYLLFTLPNFANSLRKVDKLKVPVNSILLLVWCKGKGGKFGCTVSGKDIIFNWVFFCSLGTSHTYSYLSLYIKEFNILNPQEFFQEFIILQLKSPWEWMCVCGQHTHTHYN